jgi:GT2 family glycosyltransferase
VDRPALSVVIPTRNRVAVLLDTLAAVDASRGVDGPIEVIVVDDGSSDDTLDRLAAASFSSFDCQVMPQPQTGPAAARNRGIARAAAARVLLLGDDTIPRPDTLAIHLAAGDDNRRAVQGRIDWDPDREITEVMRFLAPEGPQFYFKGLEDGQTISWTALLASNMSAPSEWFRAEPFDERFPIAGFEDTELAYRWAKRGWRFAFSQHALCWHRHRYDDLEPFLERQRRVGACARMAVLHHPGMLFSTVVQPAAVGLVFFVRHGLRRMIGSACREEGWDLRCREAFFKGVLAG